MTNGIYIFPSVSHTYLQGPPHRNYQHTH